MSWRDVFGQPARTVETVFPGDADLDALFAAERPLRVKFGIDLTSTQVTIGNAIPLRLLARFQELGHTPVLILGTFTTLVGDPSGRDKTRPVLTPAEVARNGVTWLEQIGRILDVDAAEVRSNDEWLGSLRPEDILKLTGQLTVAQMLERESFQKRYASGTPIHLHEFLYCLFQGYDSVVVEADVELGGTDQTFNLNVGRTLQKHAGQKPQVCVINPLLEGVDGSQKMSKSLGNAIGLDDEPRDMFGLATRVPDELVGKYLRLATDLPDAAIEELLEGDVWEAKKRMAAAVVARYHGDEAGERERAAFASLFQKKEVPDDIPEAVVAGGTLKDVVRAAFGMSGGEAQRLIEQGGVTIDGEKRTDPQEEPALEGGEVLRAGKRRFVRVRLGG